eukprot:TRINITY_DN74201_c0_g1_i1.p1 TRINITY_DN74201_c0_g1~~TRINITY_DN74201_c0_g1_i1.p1  ORF type:complete len:231 (-),score=35.40 TRINITY_DN74201_c0_g1_i1:183-824(-)
MSVAEAASEEARQLSATETLLQGWLLKQKTRSGYVGRASRLLGDTNRRFFTLDFRGQIFYYSHSEGSKQISMPIPFKNLVAVERLSESTDSVQAGAAQRRWSFSKSAASSSDAREGFAVDYMKSSQDHSVARLHLICNTHGDACKWISALQAAIEVAGARNEAEYHSATLLAGDISTEEGDSAPPSELGGDADSLTFQEDCPDDASNPDEKQN